AAPVAQLWWASPSQVKAVVATSRLYPAAQNLASRIDHAFAFAEDQLARTAAARAGSGAFPINTDATGAWTTSAPAAWTSGFLAGAMRQVYAHDPRKTTRLAATSLTRELATQAALPVD